MKKGIYSFLLLALFTTACSSGGGGTPAAGTATGKDSIAYSVINAAPTGSCPNGGITVYSGIDTNGNGVLDQSEITSTQYVCNGLNGTNGTSGTSGANGLTAMISTVPVSSGSACLNGGYQVNAGLDSNGNGVLDPSEISTSDYVCNGANGTSGTNGANGTNGYNSLVSITTETAGTNCATGGIKVSSGIDTNSNGVLDQSEVTATKYVCNGPGSVVIESIAASPAVVSPGQSATLAVSATDGLSSALTYSWSSSAGTFSGATNASSAVWSAPNTVGSYMVSVQVSNGASTVIGYASILVSASPEGPVITSVSPAQARTGDQITITGAGFGTTQAGSAITIGNAAALGVVSWSDTVIKALVPTNVVTDGSGVVSVVVTVGGSNSSPGSLLLPWSAAGVSGNMAVASLFADQKNQQLISDGNGGAIITWQDQRNIAIGVYAQHVDRSGTPLWDDGGVPLNYFGVGDQINPQITTDGSGGAYILWLSAGTGVNYNLYVQHINSAGTLLWPAGGLTITTSGTTNTLSPRAVSDGNGGVIVTWMSGPDGMGNYSVYAQRLNSNSALWTNGGVVVDPTSSNHQSPQLVSDGSGGAIITWQDHRSGTWDVYAQRLNSLGNAAWAAAGVAVCNAAGDQTNPQPVSDGNGGAIITWQDSRAGSGMTQVYAGQVSNGGSVSNYSLGTALRSLSTGTAQTNPQIASDGNGGAIVAWENYLNGTRNVYAQRISNSLTPVWTAGGIALAAGTNTQLAPQVVSDGSGGAIITWQDKWVGIGSNYDIRAQRVSSAGSTRWAANGVGICTSSGDQTGPMLIPDGIGGAIITWQDKRDGVDLDIYAQRVNTDGAW